MSFPWVPNVLDLPWRLSARRSPCVVVGAARGAGALGRAGARCGSVLRHWRVSGPRDHRPARFARVRDMVTAWWWCVPSVSVSVSVSVSWRGQANASAGRCSYQANVESAVERGPDSESETIQLCTKTTLVPRLIGARAALLCLGLSDKAGMEMDGARVSASRTVSLPTFCPPAEETRLASTPTRAHTHTRSSGPDAPHRAPLFRSSGYTARVTRPGHLV